LIDKHLRKYGLREKDMEYMIGKNGKPSFENHPEINFSISHSKDLVLVAFSDIEIGCDIQIVKNIDSNIFDKVLSGDEKNNVCTTINDGLTDNNNELQLEKFFYYWVQKETILKRDGSGLKDDISKIYDTYGVVKKLMYNKQKNSIDKMLDVHNIEDLSRIKLQDFEKYDIYLMCINNGKSNEFIELHESY
ncbi:MAG: 4'-phosphopantetheinyl transferase superfamily protein, partial [Lachnospiraceae bacterium]|nr:4'-phosphopantetheinyl transferase superfamily protein [Lachnospiraceae bacterium]